MTVRRTLAAEAVFDGLGLHSGVPVKVRVIPGDSGVRFWHGTSVVQAIPENVTDTKRCTRLADISTIEHLMSAFAGLEVTDAEVEVSAPELPAMDGSSACFVRGIEEAGIMAIGEQDLPEIFTRVFVQEEEIKIAASKGTGHWTYRYLTGDRWPGQMIFEAEDVLSAYREGIAPARTFAFTEDVAPARAAGMGLGLDETSALILGEHGFENSARFPDEPARHKLLDLIGDLYLSGVPIRRLNVSAERSGHRTNIQAAILLRKAVSDYRPS